MIYILEKTRKETDIQFFMHQFIDAYIMTGGERIHPLKYHRYFSFICRKLRIGFSIFKNSNKLIVCSDADQLLVQSLPHSLKYEIIPMLWDCWPGDWNKLIESLIFLKVKIVFVTSSQVAKMLNERLPFVHSYYIPEGIDPQDYNKGVDLCDRPYELYELGRLYLPYHDKVTSLSVDKVIKNHFYSEPNNKGVREKLAFTTYDSFMSTLSKIKIVVSFPQNITNPERAGNIETLTQRYWESMLSRNIIVGQAPEELIELIGYNPVINANLSDPCGQIISILNNIKDYQDLVDKNHVTAMKYSSWLNRIVSVKEILNKEFGYNDRY